MQEKSKYQHNWPDYIPMTKKYQNFPKNWTKYLIILAVNASAYIENVIIYLAL